MNRIVIIGNGFDLAHGLDTRYSDFIDYLWERERERFSSHNIIYRLDSNKHFPYEYKGDFIEIYMESPFTSRDIALGFGCDWFKYLNECRDCRIETENTFLNTISQKLPFQNYIDKEKGYPREINLRLYENAPLQKWVNIEEEYFLELTKCLNDKRHGGIKKLNEEFSKIKIALEMYLNDLHPSTAFKDEIRQHLEKTDHNGKPIGNTLFLNFNYTSTIEQYAHNIGPVIYIHGKLKDSDNPIIFGYGDELNENHKLLENKNDNEYLKHIKSIEYLKTDNYKRLQAFMDSDEYEIFIMGHSCGVSDRTLLNNLFEHKHCRSIRVFYHKRNDGTDDYFDVECNIYRNFNDKNAMRGKVVSKKDSVPLL